MTPHLSPLEFVDLAEEHLAGARAAHVDTCAACAEQAARVREALDATRVVDVPEPSPLFWRHFADRVREAAAEAGAPHPRPLWRMPAFAVLSMMVIAAVLFAAYAVPRAPRTPQPAAIVHSSAAVSPAAEAQDDPAWDFLADAASEIDIEQAEPAAFSVRPQAIDRAVSDLTPAEREEFGRLLRSELKRAGA